MNKTKCPFYIRLSATHITKQHSRLVILKHLNKKSKEHYSIYGTFTSLNDINAVYIDFVNDIDADDWIRVDTSSLRVEIWRTSDAVPWKMDKLIQVLYHLIIRYTIRIICEY